MMLALAGCAADLRDVEVEGLARSARGGMAYLALWIDGQPHDVDSCRVGVSGRFELACKVETCELAELRFERNAAPVALVLRPGDRIEVQHLPSGVELRGSYESEQMHRIERRLSDYNAQLLTLAMLGDSLVPNRAQQVDSIVALAQALALSYIDDNPYTLTAMLLLNLPLGHGGRLLGYAQHRDAYQRVARCLGGVYSDKPDVQRFCDMVRRLEVYHSAAQAGPALQPGDMMPTLRVPLPDSTEMQIPGVPARLVLLEFAAQWGDGSGPADLSGLYERYRSRGLAVVQVVSTLNASPLADTVPWVRTMVGNPQEYSIFSQLNIAELPCNFLIDRHGRLLARDVHGEELERLVERSLPRPVRPVVDTIRRLVEPVEAMPSIGIGQPIVTPVRRDGR